MAYLAMLLSLVLQAQDAQAPKQEMAAAPAVQGDDWKVVTLGKSKMTFYGFLRLDMVYDTDRPDNTQIPSYILSEDLSTAGGESDFTMHPRLTRLGMDFEGPAVEELANAKVTGKLEVDFYNIVPGISSANNREFLRMRHAWAKLAWEQFSLLAGQREDVISPLAPTPNNDFVMWGAGNLADRRAQVRPEFKVDNLTLTGMIGLTGAVDRADTDANGYLDGEVSSVPTLQGRAGYLFDGWVEKKKNEVGLWGHWGKEELDTPLATGEDDFNSTAFGVDLTLHLHDRAWLKFEAWSGKNLDDVRGGILQGVVAGEEIKAKGGWIEIGFQATPNWVPSLGASLDDPDDDDLPATGRDRNRVIWIANRLKFGPVEFGADYLNWQTEFVGSGIDDGRDNRFNVFMAYNF